MTGGNIKVNAKYDDDLTILETIVFNITLVIISTIVFFNGWCDYQPLHGVNNE